MKRLYALFACLCMAVAANAQTWKLTDMTDETFASGGDARWAFEKYTYDTGAYTQFLTYDMESAVNYVDIYQPERTGGMLIQMLENVTISGEYTPVYYRREAWYDTEWTAPSRTDANEKFVYVSRLKENSVPEELLNAIGNAIEVCGNQQYTPAISFSVPETGYYKVEGNIIRQDGANLKAIHVVPRFRHSGSATIDQEVTMGLAFPFGEGGEFIDGVTNFRLADGGEQRYTAQEASDFAFAFKAKKGDIISFEVNYSNLATSTWPRDYYPRSFYRQLDITQVDETTAEADENFVDPYDEGVLNQLRNRMDEITDSLYNYDWGTGVGMIPLNMGEGLQALLEEYTNLLDDETINSTNAGQYLEQLEEAWSHVQASINIIDMTATGNYYLISSTVGEDGNYVIETDKETMGINGDDPWGFYSRVVSSGTFEKLENHNENNLSKESAWYRGSNQWFYITDNGAMHPLTDRAPGIMFNALEDGVYRLDLSLYRPNPNPSVENPLYVRWYHLYEGAEKATTDNRVLSEQYGSVANDGEGGKKPISTALYAYLKQGDRLFFEIDCYTSNRNSSAGTQILNLSVATHVTDEEPISIEMAQNSGLLFLNPYGAGDCTELKASIARADSILNATVGGTAPGQYPEDVREALEAAIADARTLVALEGNPELTQSIVDQMARELEKAIEAYLGARNPVTLQPDGQFGIRMAGTDKFITKKNQGNGQYYYADICNLSDVEADIARVGSTMEDYTWTFTFTPVEDTNDVTITTENGYMTPDAYIAIVGEDGFDGIDLPTYTLVKEEPEDSTFAIRRNSDGRYWGNKIEWKSPYNKITTSSTPLYLWVIDSATITAIERTETCDGKALRVEFFDLSGRRLSDQFRGIAIRRTTYSDGRVKAEKFLK